MKTVKICYPVNPYYCPNCKTLYFSQVECSCKTSSQNNSQRKKDKSDSSNEVYLGTQKLSGEGNKSEQMPEQRDNHADINIQDKYAPALGGGNADVDEQSLESGNISKNPDLKLNDDKDS